MFRTSFLLFKQSLPWGLIPRIPESLLVLPGGSLGLCLFVGGPCCDGFHRAPGRHFAARQAAGCGRGHVGPVHPAHGTGEGLWAGEKNGWVMGKPWKTMENTVILL